MPRAFGALYIPIADAFIDVAIRQTSLLSG
jgi:hypothetical protein